MCRVVLVDRNVPSLRFYKGVQNRRCPTDSPIETLLPCVPPVPTVLVGPSEVFCYLRPIETPRPIDSTVHRRPEEVVRQRQRGKRFWVGEMGEGYIGKKRDMKTDE